MTESEWTASYDCGGVTQILDPASSRWLRVRAVTCGAYSHVVVREGEDGASSTVTARAGTTFRIRSA